VRTRAASPPLLPSENLSIEPFSGRDYRNGFPVQDSPCQAVGTGGAPSTRKTFVFLARRAPGRHKLSFEQGITLGQSAVPAKAGDLAAIPDLLDGFDLEG
jgi:hypothetical protein